MIDIIDATKKYKEITVLNNVTVSFDSGKIHGIVGRNGSGKTMLMKCICGLIPLTSGTISINNKIIGKDIDVPPQTGAIIENPGFLPNYSGMTNLKLLAAISGNAKKEDIIWAIERVGLNPKEKKHVGCYSMGMRQRLGIAQAIMEAPSLLILDEPMNGLDEKGVDEIRSLLNELRNSGVTIILATHNLDDVNMLCDDVFQMELGRLNRKEY